MELPTHPAAGGEYRPCAGQDGCFRSLSLAAGAGWAPGYCPCLGLQLLLPVMKPDPSRPCQYQSMLSLVASPCTPFDDLSLPTPSLRPALEPSLPSARSQSCGPGQHFPALLPSTRGFPSSLASSCWLQPSRGTSADQMHILTQRNARKKFFSTARKSFPGLSEVSNYAKSLRHTFSLQHLSLN